jgi:hypothetical protein
MRLLRLAVLALLASAALPRAARAQDDDDDFAAYLALVLTPAGALPSRVVGADVRRAPSAIDFRYGRISFESDDVTNNLALGFGGPAWGRGAGGSARRSAPRRARTATRS